MLNIFRSKDKKIEKRVLKSEQSLKIIIETKPEEYETNEEYIEVKIIYIIQAVAELDKRLKQMHDILLGKVFFNNYLFRKEKILIKKHVKCQHIL